MPKDRKDREKDLASNLKAKETARLEQLMGQTADKARLGRELKVASRASEYNRRLSDEEMELLKIYIERIIREYIRRIVVVVPVIYIRSTYNGSTSWWMVSLIAGSMFAGVLSLWLAFATSLDASSILPIAFGSALLIFLIVLRRNPARQMRNVFSASIPVVIGTLVASSFKLELPAYGIHFGQELQIPSFISLCFVILVMAGLAGHEMRTQK